MQVDDSPAVRALVGVLQRVCAALPGAEQYVMVHHPAFRVGKKPFAIAGMEQAKKGATVSVNLGREAQMDLLEDARFARTPYIGQHGWVTVAASALRDGELAALVSESWQRVAGAKRVAARAASGTTRHGSGQAPGGERTSGRGGATKKGAAKPLSRKKTARKPPARARQ